MLTYNARETQFQILVSPEEDNLSPFEINFQI